MKSTRILEKIVHAIDLVKYQVSKSYYEKHFILYILYFIFHLPIIFNHDSLLFLKFFVRCILELPRLSKNYMEIYIGEHSYAKTWGC